MNPIQERALSLGWTLPTPTATSCLISPCLKFRLDVCAIVAFLSSAGEDKPHSVMAEVPSNFVKWRTPQDILNTARFVEEMQVRGVSAVLGVYSNPPGWEPRLSNLRHFNVLW